MAWDLTTSRKWALAGIDIQPPNDPTEARFSKAQAFATEAGTLVTWRTGYEVENLGFKVYREDEHGERILLNRSLVAGSALFAGPSTTLSAGRSYVFWDAEAGQSTTPFWLKAIDLDGGATWYGPFLSKAASEKMPIRELGGMSPFEARILSNPSLTQVGRSASKARLSVKAFDSTVRRGDRRVGGSHGQWRVAAAPAAKILVDHAGWYRVTRAELAAAGYDPGPNATGLKLLNQGHGQAIRISGLEDGRLDMEDAVEFYARGVDTASTDMNVYWLTQGVRPGRRMTELPGDSGAADPVATFAATVTLKDRSLYVAAVTNNGERDNFYGPVVGSEALSQVLNVDALPPAGAHQAATLEIALQGVTTADHRISVSFNGHELEEMMFSGSESSTREYQIDPSWLRPGANEVILQAENGDDDVCVTDSLSLTWQRPFVANGDRLEMTAPPGATVRVSGFSEKNIRLFDVTNRYQPVEIRGAIGQDTDGSWAVEAVLPGAVGDGNRALYAVTESQVEAPAGLESNHPSSWHAAKNDADMVIISHSDLLSSAQRLATHRSAQGVSTTVVDVADLYDEFSWGIKDPEAIRVFLKRAAAVWQTAPRYVLLMGDASMDPRNYLGFGNADLVPTRILATNFLKTANDDWFADLDGSGLANLAVGRLPARMPQEADTMVDKIIGYEEDAPQGPWSGNLTLVADATTEDFDFQAAADALEDLIPGDLTADRIDLGELDQATARQKILDAFDAGRLLVNYDGHGSQAVWVSDSVFGNEDALSLDNGLKLPLVVAMNCLNGLFHDVYQDSLAEALLKNPNGGAVMVWASSALTDPTGQDLMNRDLYRSLFGGDDPAVGDAVLAAKANVTDQDTRNTWILFGDPSMHLRR
ncbi:MAG: C25 family cysteine peptidase [Pirellulales bacterium]